ncbi:hypothetical protein MYRNA_55 [Mycobacterium phage Myrna]|uniref:Uncharacterized protein n=1 Tax=Mycobacterium phage Myrna TaxID=546805 RepID=B5LJ66_9CAUD|nr:gp55 [Mycobacterium phage Myrna]ACH62063.1 hypothetical protein MYRNA_55 [Mycobacterium phage Myrna]
MTATDIRSYHISITFEVPDGVSDPFDYREEITELMKEAGWPDYHSAGFGCGYGDIAWSVPTTEGGLIDSLAILIDRLGEFLARIEVKVETPMTDEEIADEIAADEARDAHLAELRRTGKLDEWFAKDTAERMDDAYRHTFGYKPTMDATMLHAWAQSMIEKITNEQFKMEYYL